MILQLLIKDLKVLLSNRKSLIIFILMPVILTTILSFSLKDSFQGGGKFNKVNISIVKQYDVKLEKEQFFGKLSSYVDPEKLELDQNGLDFEKMFFENFLGNESVKSILNAEVMSEEEAKKALGEGSVVAIFYLPEGFIYNQLINFTMPYRNEITVTMLADPEAQYSSMIAEAVMNSYFEKMNEKVIQKNVFIEVGAAYLEMGELFDNMKFVMEDNEVREVQKIQNEPLHGNRPIDGFVYFSISMMSMFILYASGHTGRELLKEKRMLTLSRGTVAGVSSVKVLASKFLMTMILCTLQMTILLVYAKVVLGVDWIQPLLILVSIITSSVAVAGVGIFISAITLTQESYKVANIFESVIIHVFALIGGSYIPLESLPSLVSKFKIFALNGTVLDLFLGIYKGLPLADLVFYMVMLIVIGIIFSLAGLWLVVKKEAEEYA